MTFKASETAKEQREVSWSDCYDVPGLPRTDNALEQLFGSTRHHERRCTGRKVASPSPVLAARMAVNGVL